MKKFAQNGFFKIFASLRVKFFFSKLKFFENFDIQPPNFLPSTCLQDNKLQEVWHP